MASDSDDRRWMALTRRESLAVGLSSLAAGTAGCVRPPGSQKREATELELPEMSRAVKRVVVGVHKREGAGFEVNRPFPTREMSLLDPFLLLDEFGPKEQGPYQAKGAPDHPHRGFETVTYILEGDVHHRDSMGHDAVMGAGGVQWMTAGSGIVHSEMPSKERYEKGGRIHGFQLWVNLPRELKMMTPQYQELLPEQVAQLQASSVETKGVVGEATGKVVAGEAFGVKGAIQTTLPTSYQHWSLKPGSVLDLVLEDKLGEGLQVAAWVFRGAARLGAKALEVRDGSLAIFGPGESLRMGAEAGGPGAELLLLAAKPLKEPVARRGPFVMNTQAEIAQAYADYRSGKMGSIPPA